MNSNILFEIQGILYLAPLTSTGKTYLENNKKHKRIVYPLENGELGYIRMGNIIPVPRSELTPIIISEINDDLYKNLLLDQYNFLSKQGVSEDIRIETKKLYNKRYNNDNYYLADIMCDFKKLEDKCNMWDTNR